MVIRVRDNGIGIPAELMPMIFNLFTQLDRTSGPAQSGLGIGLALVQRLVEMHGGSVTARSDGLGHGSEFVIRLPLFIRETDRVRPTHTATIRAGAVDDERRSAHPNTTPHPGGRR